MLSPNKTLHDKVYLQSQLDKVKQWQQQQKVSLKKMTEREGKKKKERERDRPLLVWLVKQTVLSLLLHAQCI